MGDKIEGDINNTMDKAVRQIYLSCDRDNKNSVPVSTLVAFVKPYMPADLNELENLQAQLDPSSSDPSISSSFFYKVMHDWVCKIKVLSDENSLTETAENQSPFVSHSTPNSKRYYELVKSCSKILNNSQVSFYESNNTNNSIDADDKSIVHQQLHEMESQIQRMSNELDLVKQQLAVAEEQNECLASENQKITKSLYAEQQTNEQLRKDINAMEELKESINSCNKKINQLEKTITSLRNEQLKLCNEKNQLEDRTYDLCTKLDISSRVEQGHNREIIELKNLIDIREADVEDLMKQKKELEAELEEKNDLIKFYINENELLKIQSAEKTYQDNTEIDEVDIENNFNSPHLLHQLANPISPKLDSSILWKETFLKNHRSTPMGQLPKQSHSLPEINSSKRSQTSTQDSHEECETCDEISFQKSKKLRIVCNQKSLLEELLEVSEPDEIHFEDILNRLCLTLNDNKQLKNENLRLNSLKEELRDLYNKNMEIIEKSKEMVISLCEKLDKCLPVQIDSKVKNSETLLDEIQELVILIEYLFSKEQDNTRPFNSGNLSERQQMKVDMCQMETQSLQIDLESQKAFCSQIQAELITQNVLCSQLKANINEITDKYKIEMGFLHSQIKQIENENAESGKRLQIEKNKNQEQEIEINRIKTENSQLQRAFNDTRNRNIELCCEVANLKTISNNQFEFAKKKMRELDVRCNKEIECLRLCLSPLREENVILRLECDNLKGQLQQLIHINQQFLIKQQFYEQNTQKEKMNQEKLMEQINLFKRKIVDIEGLLQQKNNEITKLSSILKHIESKLHLDSNELVRIVLTVLPRLNKMNCDEKEKVVESVTNQIEQIQKHQNQGINSCDKELSKLSEYIKVLLGLLHFALDRYNFQLIDEEKSSINSQHFSDEDEISLYQKIERTDEENSFNSCLSEISMQWLEDLQYQIHETDELDLFVESFSIPEENVRNLSREEMEQKFTSFALTLPLDIRSSKKRYQNQQELYSEQIVKYLEYLNGTINLLLQFNRSQEKEILKSALTYLQLLKNITLDVVKSAEKCGLLHYEKRATNLWNFVVNYVAVLTKENKKQIQQPQTKQNLRTTKFAQTKPNLYRSKTPTFWVKLIRPSLIIIVTVILLTVSLFFYVQWKCQNETKTIICPLDWILDGILTNNYHPFLN